MTRRLYRWSLLLFALVSLALGAFPKATAGIGAEPELEDAVVGRQVDVVLTQPPHYSLMAQRDGPLSPDDQVLEFTLKDVWAQYRGMIIGLGVVLTTLLLLAMFRRQQELAMAARTAEIVLARLREAETIAGMGYWVYDLVTSEIEWSEQIYRMLGIAPGTPVDLDRFMRLVHPKDRATLEPVLAALRTSGAAFEVEHRIIVGGEVRWVRARANSSQLQPGKVMGTVLDITVAKQAELELRRGANVFAHAREGIFITDRLANIVDVNAAFTKITGYSREEVLGKNPRLLSSGRQDKAFYAAMWHDLQTRGHWSGELYNRRKDGHEYSELLTISVIRDELGEVQNYIALFSDITLLKEQQRLLEHMAHYDALTKLPNRLLLADRLQQAMRQASRRGSRVAVVYLDLDDFKPVNDTYGHTVGDELLVALASRMTEALREGDSLARIGGDEFVAVLVDLADAESSHPVLQRLLDAVAAPVAIGDLIVRVTASLGVSFWPQAEPIDADQLVRQADQAMYQAKESGRNRFHVFDVESTRQRVNVRKDRDPSAS